MPVVARVVSGVIDHAARRTPEWILTAMLLGWGATLLRSNNLFEEIPTAFQMMSRVASENVWGAAMVLIASLRFIALLLNGTFKGFATISPKVRTVTAIMSGAMWLCLAVGILANGRILPGAITYLGLSVWDFWNGSLIAQEAGVAVRISRNAPSRTSRS